MADEAIAAQVHAAVSEATRRYLAERRARVKPFTRRHFSFKGALRINRRALGKDLLRTPANVFWSVPHLLAQGGAVLGRKLKWQALVDRLDRLPSGFKTDVEREIEWLMYSEWLELPFVQTQEGRCCQRDALLEEILAHPTIGRLLVPELMQLDGLAHQRGFRQRLEDYLTTYTSSRTAAADLTGSLLSLAAGVASCKQLTPGAIAIGGVAATAIANQWAIANFALGPALGAVYYGLFPATVSTGLLVMTTSGLIILLGGLSALAGVVTDPLQQALGLHEHRLLKLVDALEQALLDQGSGYRLHDAYVARIFDLWDLLQTTTRTLA